MSKLISINSYTNKQVDAFSSHRQIKLQEILKNADNQFYNWTKTSFIKRNEKVLKVASSLFKNKKEYANKINEETGKPISQSIAEVEKCVWQCEYYADKAEGHLTKETIYTDAYKSDTCFEPLGIILAIMPWNYPFWQVFRFAIPTLIACNIAVLKHTSNVFGSAFNIEKLLIKAGSLTGSSLTAITGRNIKKTSNKIEEAFAFSNSTIFGLGLSIFSKGIERIERYIPYFDKGSVFINEFVKSDPRLSFGVMKQSGYGREFGKEGILEFVINNRIHQ